MKRAALYLGDLVRRAVLAVPALGLLAAPLGGCNVETLDQSRPAVVNSCTTDRDCGSNGICTGGTCYSRTGTLDEVLLEIKPEANSPLASVSFLSMQEGLRRGDSARNIALSGPVTFLAQVQVNGEDLADGCPYLHTGKQSVAARIQFIRTGAVDGVSVSGLSNKFMLTVDTEQNSATSTSGFSKSVSLVPGLYDIYAQPVASTNCQIAPKLWRGVEVDRDSEVVAWAPPATLDLPSPLKLGGRIQRTGGTLADWQLEIIDPQDGKVISTSARLGATTDTAPLTNFEVNYQPLEYTATASNRAHQPGALGLLIRLKPPKDGESTVPTVYADLEAAAAGTGQVNLDVSKLPPATSLVTVTGQVRGADNNGVRSTVTFVNSTFQIQGLPAAFGPAAATDETGRYTTRLFPGSYRVIIVPEGADDNIPASAKPARPWALTERQQTIGTEPTQVVDMTVARTRVIEGFATAGIADGPAQGATLEASPLDTTPLGVLGKVFTPPVSPSKASVAVDDSNGHFSLILDPGYYDFVLKPATTSNFAWWIFPSVRVLTAEQPGQVGTFDPQLLYPVPLKGIITVTMPDKTAQPLRNAIVQAYARTPAGNVTQVGTARTDDMGRYYVALPPSFYSP